MSTDTEAGAASEKVDINLEPKQICVEADSALSLSTTEPVDAELVVEASLADETLAFMEAHKDVRDATPQEERRVFWKSFVHVWGLTWLVCLVLYMDKATLSYSTIMGLFEKTHLTQDGYNDINTLFYAGFLIGQLPGALAIQRFRMSRVLFCLTFLWAILTFLICTATNFSGLCALRFFLGLVEAPTLPILTTTNGMFVTKRERAALQPFFYASCLISPVPIGFIALGVLYSNTSFGDYKVLHIIIGGICFILSFVLLLIFPDNPTRAWFLSEEEKVWVIRRVQRTQLNTIEQKTFKKAHAFEALKDPISWLFVGFFLLQQLANNLPYQQQLLYNNIGGVSNVVNTLITVAGAGYAVAWALFATTVMYLIPNSTIACIFWSLLPAWTGSIVAVALPYSNSVGILAAICLASQSFGVSWICAYDLAASTAGSSYTKRLTRGSMVLVSYSVANMISPQLWQASDAPRFVPAWIVQIVLSFSVAPSLMGIAWFILRRRNKERERFAASTLAAVVEKGSGSKHVVNISALDLTDLEDKSFIYPL